MGISRSCILIWNGDRFLIPATKNARSPALGHRYRRRRGCRFSFEDFEGLHTDRPPPDGRWTTFRRMGASRAMRSTSPVSGLRRAQLSFAQVLGQSVSAVAPSAVMVTLPALVIPAAGRWTLPVFVVT